MTDSLFNDTNLTPAERAQSRLTDAVIELAKAHPIRDKSPKGLDLNRPTGAQVKAWARRDADQPDEERQEELAREKRLDDAEGK